MGLKSSFKMYSFGEGFIVLPFPHPQAILPWQGLLPESLWAAWCYLAAAPGVFCFCGGLLFVLLL